MSAGTEVKYEPTVVNNTANHNMPPSKVLHCRAVCAGCREQDLIQVAQRFGNITAIRMIPAKYQALIEFETLDSAMACVTYSNIEPLVLRDRVMYVNYSKSSSISRKFNDSSKVQQPTHILLMTIINVIHPVNVDTIKKICEQQNIQVQRIVFFHKNGLQALVEFSSVTDASHIQKTLNGCDIYPGCCTLKIEFSSSSKLKVHSNTPERYNIDIGETDPAYQGGWNNYMGGAPNYLDQYASPFTDGTGPGGGGEGCVALVHGIDNEKINCNHLFNLFALYGNITKIKVLVKKQNCAMVQYANKMSTEMAIENLNGLHLFEKSFQVSFSKHLYIAQSGQEAAVFDGSPATVDYSESRNNRFKHLPEGRNNVFSMIHPPSAVLHYFNAPTDCTKERLEALFENHNAEVPRQHLAISRKSNTRTTSGLLEFSSISTAVEALMLVNHVTLHKEHTDVKGEMRAPFTFKLAFSTSQSINMGNDGVQDMNFQETSPY